LADGQRRRPLTTIRTIIVVVVVVVVVDSYELVPEKEQSRSVRRKFRLFRPEERPVPTLRHSKYDLFVRHPCACTRGAPKSNNDLNRPRVDDVRFRVISVARAHPLTLARGIA
jgi:hypothetical protein